MTVTAVFDQPSFVTTRPEDIGKPGVIPNFIEGAHETWRATFKDYVICNCQVVKEIHWSREVKWIIDLPSAPNVTVDINKGHQSPPTYGPVTVVAPTDPTFQWANEQLKRDRFPPVP